MDAPHTSRLELTARLFKARASRYAILGVSIALMTVVAATLLVCGIEYGDISLTKVLDVQKHNPALWLLDLMPFVFAFWGQYTSTMIAYQASALVMDETDALREKTRVLEYQLEHGQAEGPRLGLPNRRALRSSLTQDLNRPEDASQPAILMIEIEQLRDVDRMLGEQIADDLMHTVAQRLQNITNRDQVLAYLGNNEFGLLCRGNVDVDEVRHQSQRILRALDTPVTMAGMQISLQARIGAAIAESDMAADAEVLLRRAEIAKYGARSEHNEFQLYDPAMESSRAGHLSLTAELHASLNHDGLQLGFAPQLRLADGRCLRLRQYARWPHPKRGLLEEDSFLNLSERGGLLHALSLWLLQQGLNHLEQWRRNHNPALELVIRLPDQSLSRLPLSEMVTRLLAAHDLPGRALVLTFNEGALRAGGQAGAHQLETLVRRGVGICLEGLGGPQCGLTTLLDYHVTDVSLSATLIQRAQQDLKAYLLLTSTTALARQMKLRCHVGHVETQTQLEALQELACDWVEGPAIHHSLLSAEDTLDWLQTTDAVNRQDESQQSGLSA